MNMIRKVLCVAALGMAALLCAPSVEAQGFSSAKEDNIVLNAGTNKVVALSTNGFYSIDVPKAEQVVLFADVKYLNAVGAGDVNGLRVDIFRGVSSGIYESNVWATWTIQANATTTTANSQMTNFNVAATPYLRFRIANVSTNAHATNVLFRYTFKN
jgi:hypothetical protein